MKRVRGEGVVGGRDTFSRTTQRPGSDPYKVDGGTGDVPGWVEQETQGLTRPSYRRGSVTDVLGSLRRCHGESEGGRFDSVE